MNNAEQEYTQPLGLDIGTSRIVVARNGEKKCQYDAQLNAFLTIPYSKLAESLLQREEVFHEVQGADIVVAGDEARKFAEIFHVETRRPMANGVLNPHEPHSLAVIRRIIGKLLGPAAAEGQKVFFSVPAPTSRASQSPAGADSATPALPFYRFRCSVSACPRPGTSSIARRPQSPGTSRRACVCRRNRRSG